MILDSQVNNEALLDRICQVYGFTQKIQLARHFNIAASSLQNRYARGTISYDFAVHCALETGASLRWLFTGEGPQHEGSPTASDPKRIPSFTLSEGQLSEEEEIRLSSHFFNRPFDGISVRADGRLHFVDKDAVLSDGLWLVNVEGAISIRELTVLPGRRLHVAGGKVPFECDVGAIITLGRVIGMYSEVN